MHKWLVSNKAVAHYCHHTGQMCMYKLSWVSGVLGGFLVGFFFLGGEGGWVCFSFLLVLFFERERLFICLCIGFYLNFVTVFLFYFAVVFLTILALKWP